MKHNELRKTLEGAGYLIPSLDNRISAAILRLHIEELWYRIEVGDAFGARRALAGARQSLRGTALTEAGRPVAAAIERALLEAEAMLDRHDAGADTG